MALNGIDAQIMVQRTADYSKDVGNDVRKGELMQEYAATMRQVEERKKARAVTRQEAPDKVRFTGEKDRRQDSAPGEDGDGGGGRQEENGQEENGQETAENGDAATGGRIDLKI